MVDAATRNTQPPHRTFLAEPQLLPPYGSSVSTTLGRKHQKFTLAAPEDSRYFTSRKSNLSTQPPLFHSSCSPPSFRQVQLLEGQGLKKNSSCDGVLKMQCLASMTVPWHLPEWVSSESTYSTWHREHKIFFLKKRYLQQNLRQYHSSPPFMFQCLVPFRHDSKLCHFYLSFSPLLLCHPPPSLKPGLFFSSLCQSCHYPGQMQHYGSPIVQPLSSLIQDFLIFNDLLHPASETHSHNHTLDFIVIQKSQIQISHPLATAPMLLILSVTDISTLIILDTTSTSSSLGPSFLNNSSFIFIYFTTPSGKIANILNFLINILNFLPYFWR